VILNMTEDESVRPEHHPEDGFILPSQVKCYIGMLNKQEMHGAVGGPLIPVMIMYKNCGHCLYLLFYTFYMVVN